VREAPPHPGNDGGWPAWVVLFLALLAPTEGHKARELPLSGVLPSTAGGLGLEGYDFVL
jgi:hypothetical protein